MEKRIIYQNENGGMSVVIPAPGCSVPVAKEIRDEEGNLINMQVVMMELTIEQIAEKDVPAGVPYKIIDVADIPADRTLRNTWKVDMTNPHGVGADYGAGSNNAVIGWNADSTPRLAEIKFDEKGKQYLADLE